jgi:DNA replication protein DnaC
LSLNLIKILDVSGTERTAGFRIKNIKKAQMVIIDEIGYTPISRSQANRFFTFISDTYETSLIVFTTNKEITDWAEMMGDPVLTTALLDRILHHAKCFSLRGESYRLKHPEQFT